MKTQIILIGFLFIISSLQAQTTVNVFYTLEDFKNVTKDNQSDVLIERRTQRQIFMSGGNDYRIKSLDKSFDRKLKREVWGIQSGDSLFINCFQHGLGLWYAYGEIIDDKMFFTAAITMNKELQKKMAMTSYALGPIGGGISSGKLAQLRFYYILDLDSGTVTYLSKDKMLELISPYTNLTEKYKAELDPENIETLKKYLSHYRDLTNN